MRWRFANVNREIYSVTKIYIPALNIDFSKNKIYRIPHSYYIICTQVRGRFFFLCEMQLNHEKRQSVWY